MKQVQLRGRSRQTSKCIKGFAKLQSWSRILLNVHFSG